MENKHLFYLCTHTHTHTHVYTRGLSSPPTDSCWCRAPCPGRRPPPEMPVPLQPSQPWGLSPSPRVTACCRATAVLLSLLCIPSHLLGGWSWPSRVFSGGGPGGSASPVTGPLVSPLVVVMPVEAHRPWGMQWVRVPSASGCSLTRGAVHSLVACAFLCQECYLTHAVYSGLVPGSGPAACDSRWRQLT